MTEVAQRDTTQARGHSGEGGRSGDDNAIRIQSLPPDWLSSVEVSAATPPVLTARQARVLALLDQQPQPSLRDIAEAMTGNRGNVNGARQYLAALERKGFIRRDKDSHGGRTCGSKAARIVRRNDGPRILVACHSNQWPAEPGPDASMPQVM